MVGSFCKTDDVAWVQDVRANYVCIHNGDLVATVFSTAWLPWQIILHYSENAALLTGERYADLTADDVSRRRNSQWCRNA